MIKYLEKDFDTEISDDKILLDFYADWCGPCRMQGEILEEIDNVNIVKINVDKFPDLARKYAVMSIPTLILMKNKDVIKTNVGVLNISELKKFLD